MAKQHSAQAPRTHQPEGIQVRAIAWVGVSVGVILVAVALIAHEMNRTFHDAHGPDAKEATAADIRDSFAPPVLEPTPQNDIAALNAQKDAMLHGYRWINREHGVVQIPIERAMTWITQQHKELQR